MEILSPLYTSLEVVSVGNVKQTQLRNVETKSKSERTDTQGHSVVIVGEVATNIYRMKYGGCPTPLNCERNISQLLLLQWALRINWLDHLFCKEEVWDRTP